MSDLLKLNPLNVMVALQCAIVVLNEVNRRKLNLNVDLAAGYDDVTLVISPIGRPPSRSEIQSIIQFSEGVNAAVETVVRMAESMPEDSSEAMTVMLAVIDRLKSEILAKSNRRFRKGDPSAN